MPNNSANSNDGASYQGNGAHEGELRKPKPPNVPPELLTYVTEGFAAGQAEAQLEHAKWKATKTLDDLVGEDTDKYIKRFCVAEVAAYHNAAKTAENQPNSEAITALAWRTALSALSKLLPNVARERLVQLLKHRPEELENP